MTSTYIRYICTTIKLSRWRLRVLFAGVLALAVIGLLLHSTSRSKDINILAYDSSLSQSAPLTYSQRPGAEPGCVLPRLDKYNPIYEQHKSKQPPRIACRKNKDWAFVKNGQLHFDNEAIAKYGDKIKCLVTYLERVDDFKQKRAQQVNFDSDKTRVLNLTSDFCYVECKIQRTTTFELAPVWSSLVAGISPKASVVNRALKTDDGAKKLNVMFFGFDSVSHLNFMRRLPKLYKFLTEQLGALVLQQYNIVGDGTTAAMLGMLVGKYEEELPETRRGKSKTTVDVYPFVFNNFTANGYATIYAEDESSIGTFHYRLNGWEKQVRALCLVKSNIHS